MSRRAIISSVLLCVVGVVFVAWVVDTMTKNSEMRQYWMQMIHAEAEWADILQYNTAWYPEKNGIWQHVEFMPRERCDNIIIGKTVRKVVDGELTGPMIEVTGELHNQMMNVEPGGEPTDLFDVARPKTPIGPGKYLITLIATCEKDTGLETGPINLSTSPARATFTVPPPH